jgi:hypothetical protein
VYQVNPVVDASSELSSSSMSPSQSSSTELQISVAPGLMAHTPSSQSVLSETVPEGWLQASVLLVASP